MADLSGGHMNEPLPTPSLAEVRKTIATFPIYTAVGRDEWEPWTWRHLSDGAIEALTDIGMAMENMMVHPRQCKFNILKLLPKPTGGYRTIGILPTFENLVQNSSRVHSLLADEHCSFLFLV